MAIKVTVRDTLGIDLFDVSFNDNLVSCLSNYVTSEDIIKFRSDTTEYDVIGSKYVMKHTDLLGIIGQLVT